MTTNGTDADDEDPGPADDGDVRYYIGGEPDGTWSIYDNRTSLPATMGKQQLVGLTGDMARNMLELLNQIEEDTRPRPPLE